VKAETDTSTTGHTTVVPTPDSGSTTGQDAFSEDLRACSSGEGASDFSAARPESSKQSKGKAKDVQAPGIAARKRVLSSANLIGKINNLVTTGLLYLATV
jgi:hypothetical protein